MTIRPTMMYLHKGHCDTYDMVVSKFTPIMRCHFTYRARSHTVRLGYE